MDKKMLDAARSGNVQLLHQLLVDNPSLLTDHYLNPSNENPLTAAIKANQLAFASEVLMRNSQLALVQNQDGTWPLDVAVAYGNVGTVKEILMLAPSTCRLAGRDGRTAIHYAAVNGSVEIICELLSACSDCVKDVTVFGETALHLAVKYFKFEALKSMLQWLEKIDMVDMVNSEDMEGNRILHYAASRKQLESLKLVLEWNNTTGSILEVNATNKKGMTPLHILDIVIESATDVHLRAIMLKSGASSTSQFRVITESPEPHNSIHSPKDAGSRITKKPKRLLDIRGQFAFKWDRDSVKEARGTLLVVLALLVTITFQAGINPPSYLTDRSPRSLTVHLVANTVALFTSWAVMDYMTDGIPFTRELIISSLALGVSYVSAVIRIKPTDSTRNALVYVAMATPVFLRLVPHIVKKLWRCFEMKRVPIEEE